MQLNKLNKLNKLNNLNNKDILKKLFIILFIFSIFVVTSMIPANSWALRLETKWNNDFKKEIQFSCASGEEHYCINYCNDPFICTQIEDYCRNCAGTNIYIRNIFAEMGRTYWNTKKEVLVDELIQLLRSGNFVTFNSQSVFNFVDRYDSMPIRMKFQRECDFNTEYPTIILEAEPISRRLGKIRYIVCEGGDLGLQIYEMADKPRVLVGGEGSSL
ncbi:MAG: hypothetical protein HQK51_06870 [Oligoflexia bacterium]|nr:hypothetical protein [Oligoflexia bacterium]